MLVFFNVHSARFLILTYAANSTRRANAIAFDVREKGRPVREGGSPVGKPLKDEHGNTLMQPGTLKATKAIGWFIEEYGIAQVSMNITDISVTPLHIAFDEVCRTNIPFFLNKTNIPTGTSRTASPQNGHHNSD